MGNNTGVDVNIETNVIFKKKNNQQSINKYCSQKAIDFSHDSCV